MKVHVLPLCTFGSREKDVCHEGISDACQEFAAPQYVASDALTSCYWVVQCSVISESVATQLQATQHNTKQHRTAEHNMT